MICDDVRERLAEHLLGSLPESEDAELRRHLRGCAACREEQTALEDGLETFSRAAHDLAPPGELRERVLTTLAEEWRDDHGPARPADTPPSRVRSRWLAAAAAVLVLVSAASLTWGIRRGHEADLAIVDATSYRSILATLGGRDFRIASLAPSGETEVGGRVVVYDGDPAKGWSSWAIVIVRKPGIAGRATAELFSADGRTIELPPLRFSAGEASTWLVTRTDLTSYAGVRITASDGSVLAEGSLIDA